VSKKTIGVLGAVLVLGGFGFLVWGGLGSNLVYFLTPSELLARGDAAYETPVRLGGQVVPGSIHWDADALDLRFQVTDGTDTLLVQSSGAPPAMFKDTMGVVVEGSYLREGVFR
jgi:cytochrome c-type biogenesis protein CcmE